MRKAISFQEAGLRLSFWAVTLSVGACARHQPLVYPHCSAAPLLTPGQVAQIAPKPLPCGQAPQPASSAANATPIGVKP